MTILIAAATEFEMQAFAVTEREKAFLLQLLTGIGPLETAFSLTSLLDRYAGQINAVVNFGIAGAYPNKTAGLLDICLAEEEVLGDLGLWLPERIERFAERGLEVKDRFVLDPRLRRATEQGLQQAHLVYQTGTFVTVNCASGTEARARILGEQFQGLCENMEGAAVARVCEAFALPCVELRCISNIAGERDKQKWQLREACHRAGEAAAAAVSYLLRQG